MSLIPGQGTKIHVLQGACEKVKKKKKKEKKYNIKVNNEINKSRLCLGDIGNWPRVT